MSGAEATTTIPRWIPESTFADRLRMLRLAYGREVLMQAERLGAREFAEIIGVPHGTYAAWEAKGRPRDYAGVCELIAGATGCDINWLAGIEQPPAPVHPLFANRTSDLRVSQSGCIADRHLAVAA